LGAEGLDEDLMETLSVIRWRTDRYRIDNSVEFVMSVNGSMSLILNGRGERIRTSDPLVPNQVRYQTALRPELNTTQQEVTALDALQSRQAI
jgi:hypothetical protein